MYGEEHSDRLYGDAYEGGEPDAGSDKIIGGDGDDFIHTGEVKVARRTYPDGLRDYVNCGLGTDVVWYEKGIDVLRRNCEEKHPF